MNYEEIKNQYSAIISKYKEVSNRAQFIYGEAEKEFGQALAELQSRCDHRAPQHEFVDGISCPYCHKVI